MGKGGGGGGSQPQVSTAYQTNLPEYAEPYVKNMLGAAEAQVYGPGKTGFREYTPFSTNPTDYFAGPSSLQTSSYNAAGQLQSPTQYQTGSGLANMAGLGQLTAGGAYQQMATNPNAVSAYMSPYQQQVTDIAKSDAMRNAQIVEQGNRLSAARQGTYGGARQALASLEREKSLNSNLANIQAQGSQSAYDRGMQNMQYGANLGLQGLAGAAGTAGTLGQLGSSQNATDVQNIGLQNQLGGQQQQYQQGIINQQIQDYATQQQYPFMQLSTMSNLLRGLPMQGMTTQQYQAQPSSLQQGIGLLGAGSSLYGAMGRKEGGTIKEYAAGGTIRGLENKIDDIGDAGGARGLKALLAKTNSPGAKELIMERMREEGIAGGNVGKLGTNMAGGGIVAFEAGGLNDPTGTFGGMGSDDMSMDQLRVDEAKLKKDLMQYEFLKDASPVAAERFLANNPAVRSRVTPAAAPVAAPVVVKKDDTPPVPAAAVTPVNTDTGTPKLTGIDAILADRNKRLGIDGPGEKSQALMQAIEERQAGMGKERESDRYLRMAEAFAKFGSTAGPIGSVASEALGGFAKGEGAARREDDKMKLEGMKMQADLEKARRAEARGDLDAAEKLYSSAEDRKNRLEAANIGAAASGQTAQFKKESIERIMKEKNVDFATALREVEGAGRADGIDMQIASKAYAAVQASIAPGGANSKKYKELMKADPTGVAAQEFAAGLAQEQIRGMKAAMGLGGSSSNKPLGKNEQALLDKYK